ncbi:signal peptidase II [Anaeromicropila populeti]|uniref:Signal peptidase II n=1 Tax=Anaeromicropila populeti TaxID=37658 RepID=A0A1I6HUK3_9FIRM|nr:signal peptidase II [Anaeromicropila populeti]SFR58126.1 signal peptidase II [Anaeromicropila populeti]
MIFVIIAGLIFISDILLKNQIEKQWKDSEERTYFKGKLKVTKQYNKGACLNLMEDYPKAVLVVSGILLGAVLMGFALLLPKKRNYFLKTGLAMLVGGAGSNVYDRAVRGYVVDYLTLPKVKMLKKIVFNIGDFFIFLGSILAALVSAFGKESRW